MKYLIPLIIAVLILGSVATSEAACGPGLFGWHPLQNIAARRAAGKGIGQKNGPAKRLVRGTKQP